MIFLSGMVASLGMLSLAYSLLRGSRTTSSSLLEQELEFTNVSQHEPFVE